jgi:hypothetical protein
MSVWCDTKSSVQSLILLIADRIAEDKFRSEQHEQEFASSLWHDAPDNVGEMVVILELLLLVYYMQQSYKNENSMVLP